LYKGVDRIKFGTTTHLTNITQVLDIGMFEYFFWFDASVANPNYNSGSKTYNLTVVDTTAPKWYDNKTNPVSEVVYDPSGSYQFNVSWFDYDVANLTVWIEHNFSNGLTNTTVATYEQLSTFNRTYYYEPGTLAAGTYVWRMYANDSSGNLNWTDQWTFVVNKAAPLINLTLNNNASNITVNVLDNVNIVGTVITPSGDYSELYDNSSLINSGSSPLTNTTNYMFAGIYNITFIYPGNRNYTGDEISWFVEVIDTGEPTVTLNEPIDNYNTTSTSITFNCSAIDNSNLANITLWTDINGWQANETKAISGTSDSETWTISNIPDGTYEWNCIAYDDTSNSDWGDANYSFLVDTTGPIINITDPDIIDPEEIVGYDILLAADIVDEGVGLDNATYYVYNRTSDLIYVSGDITGGSAVWDSIQNISNKTDDAPAYMIIVAYDLLGNNNSARVNFTVDNKNPAINIIYPDNGDVITSSFFNINVTAVTDAHISVTNYTIVHSGGTVCDSDQDVYGPPGPTSKVWDDPVAAGSCPDGDYTFIVYAEDFAGNNRTVNSTFKIDREPPKYSNEGVSDTTPLEGDIVYIWSDWTEVVTNLDTAVIYVNHSGSWQAFNVSSLSGQSDTINVSFDTATDCGGSCEGKTVYWYITANDTTGWLNSTMLSEGYSFYVSVGAIDAPEINATVHSNKEDVIINWTHVNLADGYYLIYSDNITKIENLDPYSIPSDVDNITLPGEYNLSYIDTTDDKQRFYRVVPYKDAARNISERTAGRYVIEILPADNITLVSFPFMYDAEVPINDRLPAGTIGSDVILEREEAGDSWKMVMYFGSNWNGFFSTFKPGKAYYFEKVANAFNITDAGLVAVDPINVTIYGAGAGDGTGTETLMPYYSFVEQNINGLVPNPGDDKWIYEAKTGSTWTGWQYVGGNWIPTGPTTTFKPGKAYFFDDMNTQFNFTYTP
jgi:hypothetical protein